MGKRTKGFFELLLMTLLIVLTMVLFSGCNRNLPVEEPVPKETTFVFTDSTSLVEISIDTLGGVLPQSKEDGTLPVMLKMVIGEESLESYGTIKVQGTSTSAWPKKNWTLKFYSDETRERAIKIKIGDTIASHGWVAKAEWIDPTISRNGICFNLWGAMTEARTTTPMREVDNAFANADEAAEKNTGAVGFPKTFPARVMMDGEHYGLAMLMLGHDPDNFNIDPTNPKHVYMEFDAQHGEPPQKSWIKFSSKGIGAWINSNIPKDNQFSNEQKAAIDELGSLFNGTLENFAENFDKHLDKTNIIDMFLFMEAIYDWDAVAQDLEIVTYDLQKWYFLPWDKDTTFGLWWDGSGLMEGSETRLLYSYPAESVEEKLWYKTYHSFTDEVEARYAELRNAGVFSVEKISEIAHNIASKFNDEMWQAEYDRWLADERPSVDETNIGQILDWFGKRLVMLDEHFNYNP